MTLPMLPVAGAGPIPRTLHLIWVGSPVPDWVHGVWALWEKELPADWEIRHWTDETVRGTPLLRVIGACGSRLTPTGLADVLGVMVLSLYGGMYSDSDNLPLKSFEALVGDRPPWLLSMPRSRTQRVMNTTNFAFPAGHPFLAGVWRYASDALARGVTNGHFVAGPRAFRAVWDQDPSQVEVFWDLHLHGTGEADLLKMVQTSTFDLPALRRRFPDDLVLNVSP